jgi:hypothetical protein
MLQLSLAPSARRYLTNTSLEFAAPYGCGVVVICATASELQGAISVSSRVIQPSTPGAFLQSALITTVVSVETVHDTVCSSQREFINLLLLYRPSSLGDVRAVQVDKWLKHGFLLGASVVQISVRKKAAYPALPPFPSSPPC